MTIPDDVINDLIARVTELEQELGPNPGGVYSDTRVRLDILESRVNDPLSPSPSVSNPFTIGNEGVTITAGSGVPSEDRVPGSLFLRSDGGLDDGVYSFRVDAWRSLGAAATPSLLKISEASTMSTVVLTGSGFMSRNEDFENLQATITDWTSGDVLKVDWNCTFAPSGDLTATTFVSLGAVVSTDGGDSWNWLNPASSRGAFNNTESTSLSVSGSVVLTEGPVLVRLFFKTDGNFSIIGLNQTAAGEANTGACHLVIQRLSPGIWEQGPISQLSPLA